MNVRLQLSSIFACVLAAGMVVGAQSQNPGQGRGAQPGSNPSTSQSSSSDQTEDRVTVTGCLMSDTSSSGNQSTTPGQAQGMFKLTRAELGATDAGRSTDRASGRSASDSSRGGAGTSAGTPRTGTQASATEPTEYRLMAGPGVSLTPHLNHRVQITATRSSLGAAGRSSTDTPSANAPAGRSGNPGGDNARAGGQGQTPTGAAAAGQTARDAAMTPMLRVTNVTVLAATCQ